MKKILNPKVRNRFVTVSECLLGKNNSIKSSFENANMVKIISAHGNQKFVDVVICFQHFQRFKCLLGQKNYFNFFRLNFIKNMFENKECSNIYYLILFRGFLFHQKYVEKRF